MGDTLGSETLGGQTRGEAHPWAHCGGGTRGLPPETDRAGGQHGGRTRGRALLRRLSQESQVPATRGGSGDCKAGPLLGVVPGALAI